MSLTITAGRDATVNGLALLLTNTTDQAPSWRKRLAALTVCRVAGAALSASVTLLLLLACVTVAWEKPAPSPLHYAGAVCVLITVMTALALVLYQGAHTVLTWLQQRCTPARGAQLGALAIMLICLPGATHSVLAGLVTLLD